MSPLPARRPAQLWLRRLALLLGLALVLAGAWWAPLQQRADAEIDAGLQRALISFASARTLNGLISVVQGTSLSLQPMGVGVTLTVGELLDPINDLVEQFASLMLMASVAFGVQKLLLALGGHALVSAAVSAAALLAAAWAWRGRCPAVLTRLMVLLLLLRFAVPVVALGGELVFRELLASDYRDQQQAVELATRELRAQTAMATEAAGGADKAGAAAWLERLRQGASAGLQNLRVDVEAMRQRVEQLPERIIRLIVVFLAQTLLLPLLLLWLLYRGLGLLLLRQDPTP